MQTLKEYVGYAYVIQTKLFMSYMSYKYTELYLLTTLKLLLFIRMQQLAKQQIRHEETEAAVVSITIFN